MNFREKMTINAAGTLKTFRHQPIKLIDLDAEIRDLGRFYKLPDGQYVPSITTVLSILSKDAIDAWKKRVGDEEAARVSLEASERGTRVHSICEAYVDNKFNVDTLHQLDYKDLLSFKQIKPVLDQNLDDILLQEAPLFSSVHEVAGRTDVIGHYRGKLSIVDFKTSTKQKRKEWITSYLQQIAGYAMMFEEMTGTHVEQGVIVIACDRGDAQTFIVNTMDYRDDFIKTRQLFREKFNV